MDKALANLWAKSGMNGEAGWHPLILHMLDVAASADAILAREPESTRKRMAAILGMEWKDVRAWLLLVIACHDLGKACPGFQCKWENLTGMDSGRSPNTEINHAFVSQIALTEMLSPSNVWSLPFTFTFIRCCASLCCRIPGLCATDMDMFDVILKSITQCRYAKIAGRTW